MRLGRFGLLHLAPELEALRSDRLLDRLARHLMRRRAVLADDAGRGPWPVVLRQLASAHIVGESTQFVSRLGFEDIEAHGVKPFSRSGIDSIGVIYSFTKGTMEMALT
jgi:hypothetical protein